MDEAEFDKFAKEYRSLHQGVIGASGESVDFFAEYKVKDAAQNIEAYGFPQDLSILDFGSGIGGSVPHFLKHLPEGRLTCLDVSRKSLKIATERFQEYARFVHFDGNRIPFDENSFHVVFTACVFHHIPHSSHQAYVQEICRVLKPGGIFIAFEHNPYNFLTVKAVDTCPFDDNAVLIRGKTFQSLLGKCGLVNNKLRYRIFFPGPLRLFRPLEKLMTWIPLGAQYYVSAQKPI
jgi:ubiquinone/menaquinone biosynthesis C-methylase UbiE